MASCPSGFQSNPVHGNGCVPECPTLQGFELGISGGMPACVYRGDKSIAVSLTSVPLQGRPNDFKQAQDKFARDLPVAAAKVDKNKQLADAFKELQDAENARDASPQAYQDARIRYYTLLKGEDWINEERTRITTSEVVPTVTKYLNSYQDMNARIGQQQQTLDVVKNVKDKVLSIRDEVEYAANTFSKQIAELHNQINIEKKERKRENKSWIDFLLNILIVVVGIVVVVVLVRKVWFRSTPQYQDKFF